MAIEINKPNVSADKPANTHNKILTKGSVSKESAAKNETTAQQPTAPKEKVSLTAEAKKLNNIQQNLGSEEVLDLEKVANIKQSIIQGTYKINHESLAENIAIFEQSFDD